MKVIKRKQGNKEYFYLQYSYREKNKVYTKQKYMGTELPKNLEDIKKEIQNEQKQQIYHKIEQIQKKFQEEYSKYPESIKKKQQEELAIAFTYNTNSIEGSTITLEETREILKDKIAPRKSIDDIKETEQHAKVFLNMLKQTDSLSNELLLKWHQEIFGDTKEDIAGKYREYGIRVGIYRAPDWQDVNMLMSKLIIYINAEKINSVELAGRAHYRFEKIHPFGDGNGRLGRLLLNYILWKNKYPMIIIEKKKKKSYYQALNRDEEGFVSYFIKLYLKVHEK